MNEQKCSHCGQHVSEFWCPGCCTSLSPYRTIATLPEEEEPLEPPPAFKKPNPLAKAFTLVGIFGALGYVVFWACFVVSSAYLITTITMALSTNIAGGLE